MSLRFIFVLLSVFLGLSPVAAASAPPLMIVGATLWDGTGRPPIADAALSLKDGRIVAVGPRARVPALPGAKVIDAKGSWVMPGLIDAHVHFSQSAGLYTRPDIIDLRHVRSFAAEQAWIRQRLPETLTRYFCSGITSVADVGGPMWTLALPDTTRLNAKGPGVWASGPLLSNYLPPETHDADPVILKLTSPAHARQEVRRLAQQGAAFIKLWMIETGSLTRDMPLFEAAAAESRALGLRVFAHATSLTTAKEAVRIGANVLVHPVDDRVIDDEFVDLLKKHGVITISTLTVDAGYRDVLTASAAPSAFMRRCGDPDAIASWHEIPRNMVRRSWPLSRAARLNIKRLVDEGLVVAAGSDAGNIGTLHGPGLHQELALLVRSGLSEEEALLAATRDAAKVLSPKPEVGTLEPGHIADVLILEANPLEDVAHLQSITHVVRAGHLVTP